MSFATATINDLSSSKNLVPAEIAARMKPQGDNSLRQPSGATIDQEGLINNYALDPKLSYVAETTNDEKFRQGAIFAIVTGVLLAIGILVS